MRPSTTSSAPPSPATKTRVQALWRAIRDNANKPEPNIYLGHYEGLYCVGCEAYYTEKDLDQPGNLCKQHKTPVETLKEESYFFRLSAYADDLLAYYEAHPDFVQPPGRLNEVRSFIKAGLQDLSVSRTTFQWGIPVPDDPRHVMFVWFDALTNYRSALLGRPDAEQLWEQVVHLVGKDILRFHAVYWPAFLMAAGLPPPKHVFAHGFLTYNGEKMGKSLRNTISPVALAEALSPEVGVDVLRYCLMRAISFGQDGDFSIRDVLQRYQSELGNTLGNLVNRVLPFDGASRSGRAERGPLELKLVAAYESGATAAAEGLRRAEPDARARRHLGGARRRQRLRRQGRALGVEQEGRVADTLATFVTTTLELLDGVERDGRPRDAQVSAMIRERLGLPPARRPGRLDRWPTRFHRSRWGPRSRDSGPSSPLREGAGGRDHRRFTPAAAAPHRRPRARACERAAQPPEAESPQPPAEAKGTITYDDFAKLDLRVGVVVSAERVKKKDKLLDLRVDTGDAAPRRIIAGIAAAYAPEALVGKRVVVLCNLAPRDFGKGLVSEGMILAAESGGALSLVTPDGDKPPGSKVS